MYEDRIALFARTPGAFELYLAFEALVLERYPATQVRPKKTQVGFFDGCGYAFASPPLRGKRGITVTLGLPERLASERVFAATEPYPGRWTHHFLIVEPGQLDAEFIAWLDAAHAFAQFRRKK